MKKSMVIVVLILIAAVAGCQGDPMTSPTPIEVRATQVPPANTPTPAPTSTPTATPPMPTPTPAWTTEIDPDTGEEYLSPPPEVEAQVMEAFESVLACKVLVVTTEDVPDYANQLPSEGEYLTFQQAVLDSLNVPGEGVEKLVAFQHAVQDQAEQFLANEWVLGDQGCAYGGFQAIIPVDHLEPVPVRCESSRACTVGMVKNNYALGAVLYTSPELCNGASLGDPCAVAMTGDSTPYALYLARVERDGEDGPWQVTAFQTEAIQKPERESHRRKPCISVILTMTNGPQRPPGYNS